MYQVGDACRLAVLRVMEPMAQLQLDKRTGPGNAECAVEEPTPMERDLVDACVAGESRAWEVFVRRYGPPVAARAARVWRQRTGSAVPAADLAEIVQDTFVRLAADRAAALRRFAWRASLSTYLSVVAASCALMHLRRRFGTRAGRQIPFDPSRLPDLPDPGEESPWRSVEAGEDVEWLARAVEALPQRERLVLRMRYWEGLAVPDIARALGVSTRYVRLLSRQALSTLRRRLPSQK